jgi:hypothetical protein
MARLGSPDGLCMESFYITAFRLEKTPRCGIPGTPITLQAGQVHRGLIRPPESQLRGLAWQRTRQIVCSVWSDGSLAAPLCFNYSISRGQRKPLTASSSGCPYCWPQIQYRCGGLMPLTTSTTSPQPIHHSPVFCN